MIASLAAQEETMATDLTIFVENTPGQLAAIGEATGKAGVNLGGGCCVVVEDRGIVHLLVEGDVAAARAAIEDRGYTVEDEGEVLVFDAEDRPGELGRVCRAVADAGINITLMYLASDTRIVLGVDDLDAARDALGV
jgi:hypothetical protein